MSDTQEPGTHNLTARRHICARPEMVFRLWTEPDLLKKWWGPPGVTCTDAQIDLRVGGQYRIANLLPSGQTIWIHGKYELVNRPDKLVYSWGIGLDGTADERVTVTFMATENGTEVVVFHENAPDVSTRDSHESGWHGCLEGLAALAPDME